ncbi:flagellar protein FlgN [Jatrophihabitans telluris]|uniref:Flagellar protein FlgN n=1 Tax=Jatrophihabitans telluris TaxID=2038343 RepID=A0ABY4QYI9_9ACTN|nr:flagellar protein FlgN [Jatrophihabitans telluris]UQX87939.1 flagellar protein FlgN [Jatrophihabitans telluris]
MSATTKLTVETTVTFSEVSTLLWREREALELLLFKLVSERLIVSAGETRWLAPANREVEAVVEQLRGVEVLRAAEVEMLAADLGKDIGISLTELAELADEPWRSILFEHRDAMLKLVLQIEQTADENRRLLTAGARSIRETLLSVTDSVDTYDSRGVTTTSSSLRPVIMDEQA